MVHTCVFPTALLFVQGIAFLHLAILKKNLVEFELSTWVRVNRDINQIRQLPLKRKVLKSHKK